jgi:hypothetical protein
MRRKTYLRSLRHKKGPRAGHRAQVSGNGAGGLSIEATILSDERTRVPGVTELLLEPCKVAVDVGEYCEVEG